MSTANSKLLRKIITLLYKLPYNQQIENIIEILNDLIIDEELDLEDFDVDFPLFK